MHAETNSTPGRSALWQAFLGALSLLGLAQALLLGYLFLTPVDINPHAWRPLANPDLSGPYVSNDALTRGRLVATRWVEPGLLDQARYVGVGPETVVVGPDGYLYTGLCDAGLDGAYDDPPECRLDGTLQGWVVRINPKNPADVERYVPTGGRPLGLRFDAAGRLYIADALRGLLRVESTLGAAAALSPLAEVRAHFHTVVQVATCDQDEAHPTYQPNYTDSVDIAADGTVWFTCPSQRFALEDVRKDGLESRPTGRVVRYEPCAKPDPLGCPRQVVADDLMFANGIAVAKDGRSLLVNEWSGYRITRLWLKPDDSVRLREVFFENTPGYPDNLTIEADGTIWVGLVIRRNPVVERFHPHPFLKAVLARLPESAVKFTRHAWVIALDPAGKLKFNLQDTTGFFNQATGAYPVGNALYIASNTEPALLCVSKPGAAVGYDPCNPWATPPAQGAP